MQKGLQGSVHPSEYAGPRHVQRRCTDVVCFVLFVAVWVAAIAVGFFGYFKGDPDRITHGYDFQGNACGVGSNALFPFVYFPIPGLVHYSVCVQACPALYDSAMCAKTVAQGDTICNQGPLPPVQVMKCLSNFTKLALSGGSLANAGFCFPTYPTNDFFNRCLPLSNSTTITVGSPPVILQDFNKISSSAQLTFQFESGELVNGKYLIIACAALSLGLAIVYSFFLRFSTGPVVWLTIVLVFFLLLGIGSLLLFKAGLLNSAFLTNEFPSYPTATVSYTSDQKTALEVMAFFGAFHMRDTSTFFTSSHKSLCRHAALFPLPWPSQNLLFSACTEAASRWQSRPLKRLLERLNHFLVLFSFPSSNSLSMPLAFSGSYFPLFISRRQDHSTLNLDLFKSASHWGMHRRFSQLFSFCLLTFVSAENSSCWRHLSSFGRIFSCMLAVKYPYQVRYLSGTLTRQAAAMVRCLLLCNGHFAFTLVPQLLDLSLFRLLRCCDVS